MSEYFTLNVELSGKHWNAFYLSKIPREHNPETLNRMILKTNWHQNCVKLCGSDTFRSTFWRDEWDVASYYWNQGLSASKQFNYSHLESVTAFSSGCLRMDHCRHQPIRERLFMKLMRIFRSPESVIPHTHCGENGLPQKRTLWPKIHLSFQTCN